MQAPSWQADLFSHQLSVNAFSVHSTAHVPHWHNRIEILYFLEDSPPTRCYYGNNHVDAVPGDMLVFNSNEVHSLQFLGDHTSHWCLGIRRDMAESFGFSLSDLHFRQPIRDPSLAQAYKRVFDLTYTYLHGEREETSSSAIRLAIHAQALALFSRLIVEHAIPAEPTADTPPQNKYEMTQAAIMYIQSHLSEPITLQDISNHLRISTSYLCHLFRETADDTVVNVINDLRCQKLRSLLLKNQYNIGECAARCGFSNTSYMSKVYRRFYNESPSDTRRRAK